MKGLFITFEGTEGSGKSTQTGLLAERLRAAGRIVLALREPGGTPIGEEIRHTLQHSHRNHAMTPVAELLLLNASRAQLVREVIRPALTAGNVVLCDRFHDSTVAYQAFGRQLDLKKVQTVIDIAVGDTRPHRTFLLQIPLEVSERRRQARHVATPAARDRMEESDREFFQRVEEGYVAIARQEPDRISVIDATRPVDTVGAAIWKQVQPMLD